MVAETGWERAAARSHPVSATSIAAR